MTRILINFGGLNDNEIENSCIRGEEATKLMINIKYVYINSKCLELMTEINYTFMILLLMVKIS